MGKSVKDKKKGRVIKENPHRINEEIRGIDKVRLVGDNVDNGVIPFSEALNIAKSMELDLVEISRKSSPIVCKVLDYSKFLYELKKKEKEQKKKQSHGEMKEIRLTPNIDQHDVDFKLRHARNFLEKGNKLRVTMLFKGRMIQYKDEGEIVMLKFAQELEDLGVVEEMPNLNGKRMLMSITPKAKK